MNPSASPTVDTTARRVEEEPPDRQADGGLTLGFLAVGGYSFAYMDLAPAASEGSGGVSAYSHLGWFGGEFDLHYGFGEHVYFGFALGVDRFVNSDDSTGTATRVRVGPSLLLRPARPFYIGIDAALEYLSFDDVDTQFDGFPNDPNRRQEMDLELALGISVSLRFGFVIQVNDLVAITPELRLSALPAALVMEGADVSNFSVGGIRSDASTLTVGSAALYLGTRILL